ncbi:MULTISPECIES: LuxR C-terminal-related transcriptional regulator [unclassified Pseudofrankia]|uniref:LuxR C-terminal-related transcriptional regulator n=1 Tax=unclassified Pseudofrankia TaxID=2994372 RepID=UPI0009F36376|nr:LuxR C-terminal-related transcriptional regulator [Pseudofrankia sp. BMG5.37]
MALRTSATDRLATLSARELEVLALMTDGRSNRAIGDQLFLTQRTVESHIRNIYGRLGLLPGCGDHRRVLAVLLYLRAGSCAQHPPSTGGELRFGQTRALPRIKPAHASAVMAPVT